MFNILLNWSCDIHVCMSSFKKKRKFIYYMHMWIALKRLSLHLHVECLLFSIGMSMKWNHQMTPVLPIQTWLESCQRRIKSCWVYTSTALTTIEWTSVSFSSCWSRFSLQVKKVCCPNPKHSIFIETWKKMSVEFVLVCTCTTKYYEIHFW